MTQLCLPLFGAPKVRAVEGSRVESDQDEALRQRAAGACEVLGLSALAGRVVVRWNRRMRSTAGRATWPGAVIELNPTLRDIGEDEVERTFLHELAHLVAFERAGRRRIQPHGPEWRRACVELGIPGERASHRLELPSRTMRRQWVYICPVCRVRVERVRRMRGHTACWTCCLAHCDGEYDKRFRFAVKRLDA